MLDILKIVLPVFIIIGSGYLFTYKQIFSELQAKTIMRFAITFALPCLLFHGVANLDLDSVFNVSVLTPFYLPALINFIITGSIAFYYFKRQPTDCVSISFSVIFTNGLLMGLAIVDLAYDSSASETALAIIAINAPFCYSLGILSMELARSDHFNFVRTIKQTAKQVFSNSLMLAIMLAFIVNLSDLNIPFFIDIALRKVGDAALPVALFGLGAVLVSFKFVYQLPQVTMVCFNKLFLHPALAFLVARFIFNLPDATLKPIVIMAAMPSGINAYVFATMYDKATNSAASTILFSTILSVFTISIWLAILD